MKRSLSVTFVVASMVVVCAPLGCGDTSAPDTETSPTSPPPSTPGGSTSGDDTPSPTPTSTGTTPPTPSGAPCSGKPALKGDFDMTIASGGRNRIAKVHLPPGYDPTKATPVVLDFHGLSMNAATQELLSKMKAKADKSGFVAVQAEGIGLQQSWNAGVCCGEAAQANIDDVGFVTKMLDELEAKLCVDEKRVFSTGMSNGGALSHRLACELSSRIAAIAPVAHVITIPQASCKPTRPISVFSFNGTADTLVPYGGNGVGYPSVADTMKLWATIDGCSTTPRETSKKGDVTCVTYDGCKAGNEVSLCTVQDGGHAWPGGMSIPLLGKTTQAISATDMMWDFFAKHPMP